MTWIVVPDGLAADASGRATPEPSFIYRAVLDWLAEHAQAGDRIYLAPANRFGGEVSEQEAAGRHLRPRTAADVIVCPTGETGYIDTRGNARGLRQHLQEIGAWPPPPVHLVAYDLHLPRAVVAFREEGFEIAAADAVGRQRVDFGNRNAIRIVRRLWYYRYPRVHALYERIARLLTRFRII